MRQFEVLDIGAAVLRAPIEELLKARRIAATWRKLNLDAPMLYSLDEAIQALRFLRGEIDIPPALRPLCSLPAEWPAADAARLRAARSELVLVEIMSPVKICYGPYALDRNQIRQRFLAPLAGRNDDLGRLGRDWYRQGILNSDHCLRVAAAERLVAAVSEDDGFPDAELACSVFKEALPRRRDLSEILHGLEALRELVPGPMALVSSRHRCGPDAPAPDFLAQQMIAAEWLRLPVFDPSEIAIAYGSGRGAPGDGAPYPQGLVLVLADAVLSFIGRNARSPNAEPAATGGAVTEETVAAAVDAATPEEPGRADEPAPADPPLDPDWARELAFLDGYLFRLMVDMLETEGEDASGLYDYYGQRIRVDRAALSGYDVALCGYVMANFDKSRPVVHAGIGLGTLTSALAVAGFRVAGVEHDERRFTAAMRLREALARRWPEAVLRYCGVSGEFPSAVAGTEWVSPDAVLIFTNCEYDWGPDLTQQIIAQFANFGDAILDTRLFGHARRSPDERDDLKKAIERLGLSVEPIAGLPAGVFYHRVRRRHGGAEPPPAAATGA